jgi:hypothetical protein
MRPYCKLMEAGLLGLKGLDADFAKIPRGNARTPHDGGRLQQPLECDYCGAGVSVGGGSSAADTDADLESQHRSVDGSEAAAVLGWSTEV